MALRVMPSKDLQHFLIQPSEWRPDGHDWGELVAHLEHLQANPLQKRTLSNEPYEEGVRNLVQVLSKRWGCLEMGWTNYGWCLSGPYEQQRRVFQQSCPDCGRLMAGPANRCRHCELARRRERNRNASRNYRVRKGLVTTLPFANCSHCGQLFERKRSTAQFCSPKCRVAAHRAKASASRQ